MAKKESSTMLGYEDKLWLAADKLRGSMDSSEYKHVALGLIFLKYVSDAFEVRQQQIAQDEYADPEDKDEYLSENVFWIPKEARWSEIIKYTNSPEIGQVIDKAMELIEKENPRLKNVLNNSLKEFDFLSQNININLDFNYENDDILEEFLVIKRVEGLSENSLKRYKNTIIRLFKYTKKHYSEITHEDVRLFLNELSQNGLSNITLENYRRIFTSFFNTITDYGFIIRNPMNRVSPIKCEKKIKKEFTNEEIELMREAIPKNKYRERAIFELLLSSGIRISELVSLNIEDINFEKKTFKVIGKGSHERICYMGDRAKLFIEQYLKTRNDNSPALFISQKKDKDGNPSRFAISSIQKIIKKLGDSLNIKAHPHKFRRTFATKFLNKNMPIEQVQKLLGHESVDTTMIYINVNQDMVKFNHEKYTN